MCGCNGDFEEFVKSATDPQRAKRAQDALASVGRVHLADFLPSDVATHLLEQCTALEWSVLTSDGAKNFVARVEEVEALSEGDRQRMMTFVNERARSGFQFFYEGNHVADRYESGVDRTGPIAEFFGLLNSERGLAGLRTLTGESRIAYVDATATRYRSGHFLNEHGDRAENETRLFAYVLNLTPEWRTDWGGLLNFVTGEGHVAEAYAPRFGALNIFSVPQAHSVSMVAPFAGASRYSISGWFRADRPASRVA